MRDGKNQEKYYNIMLLILFCLAVKDKLFKYTYTGFGLFRRRSFRRGPFRRGSFRRGLFRRVL
jgi:hypothetical protein